MAPTTQYAPYVQAVKPINKFFYTASPSIEASPLYDVAQDETTRIINDPEGQVGPELTLDCVSFLIICSAPVCSFYTSLAFQYEHT